MKFLRNLFAAILGTFIALGLIFVLFMGVATISESSNNVAIKKNSVLNLKMETLVKDYAPKSDNPLEQIFDIEQNKVGLNQLLNAIENAKTDDNIKGINIHPTSINAGISQLQTLRDKLVDFKESGKFIYAYADFYNQKAYYLSSVADSVFLNPVGLVDFKGLSSEVLYYKDFQDKVGVKMEVIRHGKYKSAVEPFLYNEMSDSNRAQTVSFLKSIWGELVDDISQSRSISTEKLNAIADNLLGRNVALAIENNLVDKAVYIDQYASSLKAIVGIDEDATLETIAIEDYIATGKGRISSSATDKIAVIYAQGEIIYGKGNEDKIGQDLLIDALKKARSNKNVKAIVLRVNSPGGSALASELIWRELENTKDSLPLVVSMGNVAASGGYYISCNATKIVAEPTTITGSIGVFGIIPNAHKLAGTLGLNAAQVSTNNAPSYSIFEPMTDAFRAVTQEGVEQVYTTFLTRVAAGRNMTVEQVDEIAQGRVWSGKEALEIGLVDALGNLDDAIAYAAELAKTTDYKVRNYPNYKIDFKEKFASFPFAKTKENLIKDEIGAENYTIYKNLKTMATLKGMQARLPYLLDIK